MTIEGTITLDSGEQISFLINQDGTRQWGNTTRVLGSTVDLLESIANAAWENEPDLSEA